MKRFPSQTSALTWECWRRCQIEIMLHLLLLALIGVIIVWLTHSIKPVDRQSVAEALAVLACGFCLYSFAVVRETPGVGFSFSHNFSKPVSTRLLVLAPLTVILLKALLMTMLSLVVIRIASGVELSFFTYLIAVQVLVMLTVSISWSVTSLLGRIFVGVSLFLILIGMVAWRIGNYQEVWISPEVYTDIGLSVFYVMGVIAFLVAPVVTIREVTKQRHQWISRSSEGGVSAQMLAFTKPRPIWLGGQYSSRFSALVWYELKKNGFSVLTGVVIVNLLVLGLGILMKTLNPYTRMSAETLQAQMSAVIALNALVVAFLGSLMVLDAKSEASGRRSFQFSSSRPVSDNHLVYSKLSAILVLLLVSFGVSAFVLSLSANMLRIGFADLITEPSSLEKLWIDYGWLGVGMVGFLGFYITLSLAALVFSILLLALRFGAIVFAAAMLLLMLFFLMGMDAEQGWQWRHQEFWQWLLAGLIVTAALWVLLTSVGSLMRRNTAWLPASIIVTSWLAFIAVFAILGLMIRSSGLAELPPMMVVVMVAGSWIAPGLTISLPTLYARLRHQ